MREGGVCPCVNFAKVDRVPSEHSYESLPPHKCLRNNTPKKCFQNSKWSILSFEQVNSKPIAICPADPNGAPDRGGDYVGTAQDRRGSPPTITKPHGQAPGRHRPCINWSDGSLQVGRPMSCRMQWSASRSCSSRLCLSTRHHLAEGPGKRPFSQGSLHYTPEHCPVNGGVSLFWWNVSNGQNVSFKEPCFTIGQPSAWGKCYGRWKPAAKHGHSHGNAPSC